MEIFSKIFSSMVSQNAIGWMVISLIILLFAIGLTLSIFINRYYIDLKEEFLIDKDNNEIFRNNEIKKIVDEFSKSTVSGTDNINTEVIIEKNLNNKVLKYQSNLKMISPTLVGLGLLGTFLGLTLAIFETKGALGSIENINTFSTALQNPIASMATAFWTSIFGVIFSIILNFKNQSTVYYKLQFYNEIENYLDNEVFSRRAKTFNSIFEEFSVTVKTTMLTLTEEMTVLFKNGVEELVNKINGNSLDLTNSAEALKDYTEKFRGLVGEMDKTVENFGKPVNSFKESIKDFSIISKGLEEQFNKSFLSFNNSISDLDSSMGKLSSDIDRSFSNMSITIDKSFTSMGEVIDNSTEKMRNDITSSSVILVDSIRTINEDSVNMVRNSLDKFSGNINETMVKTQSDFKSSMLEVASTINESFEGLDKSMDNNIKEIEKLKEIIEREGQLTNSRANTLNELINTINKINELRDNENIEQMDMLKSAYGEFKNIIFKFNKSLEAINISIAKELGSILNTKLNEIGKDIAKDISRDISSVVKNISNSADNLNDSVSIIGELVKASNDWASMVAYSLNDAGGESAK